jgi:hypothetical protein
MADIDLAVATGRVLLKSAPPMRDGLDLFFMKPKTQVK